MDAEPRYANSSEMPVQYRTVGIHGTPIGYLWFRDEVDALGFIPRLDVRTIAYNAAFAWARHFIDAKRSGLAPSEAVAQFASRGGDLISGYIIAEEGNQKRTMLAELKQQAGGKSVTPSELGAEYALNTTIQRATRIADAAHTTQHDLAEFPYILHPFRVAIAVQGETAKVVAILHDVIERTDVTLDDLASVGFARAILDAVDAVSERGAEPLDSYFARVRSDLLATEVKRGDSRQPGRKPTQTSSRAHSRSPTR